MAKKVLPQPPVGEVTVKIVALPTGAGATAASAGAGAGAGTSRITTRSPRTASAVARMRCRALRSLTVEAG